MPALVSLETSGEVSLGTSACPWAPRTSEVACSCGQSCFEEITNACPGGPSALGVRLRAVAPPQVGQGAISGQPDHRGLRLDAGGKRARLAGCGVGARRASPSPPGGLGVAPRARPPPSPPAPPSALSSGGPRGGSPSEERPLLADRRGMSSGGSRHVTRRRSSSSPSRGSNFQLPPWEQRRAALAPPAGAGGSGRGRGGAEASDVSPSSALRNPSGAGQGGAGVRLVAEQATGGPLGPHDERGGFPCAPELAGLQLGRTGPRGRPGSGTRCEASWSEPRFPICTLERVISPLPASQGQFQKPQSASQIVLTAELSLIASKPPRPLGWAQFLKSKLSSVRARRCSQGA